MTESADAIEVLEQVQQLGHRVAVEFERCHGDFEKFPAIAYALLSMWDAPAFRTEFLLGWLSAPALPAQRPNDVFSDFPLVLFHHHEFRIELLTWQNASTTIHQHAFSGAFRVWQGSSLQRRYHFEESQRFNHCLRFGDVRAEACEYLSVGDTRQIDPAARLTHSVFHIAKPSVTLVIRTHGEAWNSPQFNLVPPYLAYVPEQLKRELIPLEKWYRLMYRQDADQCLAHLLQALDTLPLATIAIMGTEWHEHFRLRGEQELFLEAVAKRHETLARHLPQASRYWCRQQQALKLRQNIDDEQLLYFIAVLMHSDTRSEVRSIADLNGEFSLDKSKEIHYVCELLSGSVLPFRVTGEATATLVNCLISNPTQEGFVECMQRAYPEWHQSDDEERLEQWFQCIREIPLLTSLFV